MKLAAQFFITTVLFVLLANSSADARARLDTIVADDDTTLVNEAATPMDCFTVEGNITGEYYPEDGSENSVTTGYATIGMQLVNLNGQYSSLTSDSTGYYSETNCIRIDNQQWYLKIPLENQWAKPHYYWSNTFVDGYDNIVKSYPFVPATLPQNTLHKNHHWSGSINNISSSKIRAASNALYHIAEIHDFFSKNPLGYGGVDTQVEVMIGEDKATRYDDGKIYLDSESSSNQKDEALASDVIYHEYTHFVVEQIYGDEIGGGQTLQGNALEEGIADYFAGSFTNESLLFEYVV